MELMIESMMQAERRGFLDANPDGQWLPPWQKLLQGAPPSSIEATSVNEIGKIMDMIRFDLSKQVVFTINTDGCVRHCFLYLTHPNIKRSVL